MKRAQLFDISMVFIVIGAMVAIVLVMNAISEETSPWKGIGQRAFEVQNAYAVADLFVSFMSTATHWASAEAFQELGKNGGYAQQSPCGSVNEFALWNIKNSRKPCIPSTPEVYQAFYLILATKLDPYGARYPGLSPIYYEFLVSNNRLLGIATAPLRLNILKPAEKKIQTAKYDVTGLWTTTARFDPTNVGIYVFRPNFEIPFAHDIDAYKKLAQITKTIIQKCALKATPAEKKSCADYELSGLSGVDVQNDPLDNDLFYFSITQAASPYLTSPPVIKFALYLQTPTPPPAGGTPSGQLASGQASGAGSGAAGPGDQVGGVGGGAATPVGQAAPGGP